MRAFAGTEMDPLSPFDGLQRALTVVSLSALGIGIFAIWWLFQPPRVKAIAAGAITILAGLWFAVTRWGLWDVVATVLAVTLFLMVGVALNAAVRSSIEMRLVAVGAALVAFWVWALYKSGPHSPLLYIVIFAFFLLSGVVGLLVGRMQDAAQARRESAEQAAAAQRREREEGKKRREAAEEDVRRRREEEARVRRRKHDALQREKEASDKLAAEAQAERQREAERRQAQIIQSEEAKVRVSLTEESLLDVKRQVARQQDALAKIFELTHGTVGKRVPLRRLAQRLGGKPSYAFALTDALKARDLVIVHVPYARSSEFEHEVSLSREGVNRVTSDYAAGNLFGHHKAASTRPDPVLERVLMTLHDATSQHPDSFLGSAALADRCELSEEDLADHLDTLQQERLVRANPRLAGGWRPTEAGSRTAVELHSSRRSGRHRIEHTMRQILHHAMAEDGGRFTRSRWEAWDLHEDDLPAVTQQEREDALSSLREQRLISANGAAGAPFDLCEVTPQGRMVLGRPDLSIADAIFQPGANGATYDYRVGIQAHTVTTQGGPIQTGDNSVQHVTVTHDQRRLVVQHLDEIRTSLADPSLPNDVVASVGEAIEAIDAELAQEEPEPKRIRQLRDKGLTAAASAMGTEAGKRLWQLLIDLGDVLPWA